ncbi:MAG: serine hydrolase [Candidatus Aminicenantes bacterium]|nr:MAG: serine hydrolase [Candidatus Aminicenantes bacterium]
MRIKRILIAIASLVFIFILSGFGCSGIKEEYWPTQEWRTSTPEEQGIDSEKLAEAVEHVLRNNVNIHSFLVIRNGHLVADVCFFPYAPDTKHDVASVTKSLTSTLIGIAVEKGLIKSTDLSVLGFFSERTVNNLDEAKKSMSLADLLTMTSGLECIAQPTEVTLFQMMGSPDWVQFMLDLPMETEPGERFVYNSGAVHLLSTIIRKATGKSALDFARSNLFEPLGISDLAWPMDPQGISNMGWGSMRMKPHDMAKLGYLYLKNGQWEGNQILPSSWVKEATKSHANFQSGNGYGYLWWVYKDQTYSALGRGGQCIYVLPEKNLIIVMTGGGLPWGTLHFPNTFILPAVHEEKSSLPANPEGVSMLAKAAKKAAEGVKPLPTTPSPLPETAKNISGKEYIMSPNPFGILAFQMTFMNEKEAKVRLNLALDTDRSPEFHLGLDGIPRMSPGRFGIPAAGTAKWESENTFVIHINEIGNINRLDITLVFENDTATMSLSEKGGLGGFTAQARIKVSSTEM